MFKKTNGMAKAAEVDGASTNRIVNGTKIVGNVVTEGDIRIDGELDGTLACRGKLVVGPTGQINGEIDCQNANVSGKVEGKLMVSEMLTVQSTGKVTGNISYAKLKVELGAELEGELRIGARLKEIGNGQRNLKQKEKTA